jgi:hypothetical protein
MCAGELPLEIIRMKAQGAVVRLAMNAGFVLPSTVNELSDDVTYLNLRNSSISGESITHI